MTTKLEALGFKGSAAFILNEEGSGAKFYNSSVYYPDNRANPVSSSGITIDPGVDLGSGDKNMINEVFGFYKSQGFLSDVLLSLLKTSIGLKKKQLPIGLIAMRDISKTKFLFRIQSHKIFFQIIPAMIIGHI